MVDFILSVVSMIPLVWLLVRTFDNIDVTNDFIPLALFDQKYGQKLPKKG